MMDQGKVISIFREGVPDQLSQDIIDNPQDHTLSLYPAGYSKTWHAVSRQTDYKRLYDIACILGTENEFYPFPEKDYTINIQPENNKWDQYALAIILHMRTNANESNSIHMGYIPRSINRFLRIDLIKKINILSVKSEVYGSYYCAKLIMSYKNSIIPENMDRYFSILDE